MRGAVPLPFLLFEHRNDLYLVSLYLICFNHLKCQYRLLLLFPPGFTFPSLSVSRSSDRIHLSTPTRPDDTDVYSQVGQNIECRATHQSLIFNT